MGGFAPDGDPTTDEDPNTGNTPHQDDDAPLNVSDGDAKEAEISDEDPAMEAAAERIIPLMRPNEIVAEACERLTNQQP